MGRLILWSVWLTLPVILTAILHMVVVSAGWLPRLSVPLDGGRRLGGKPIFGPNKTWRGVLVMSVGSGLLGFLQGALLGDWAAGRGLECVDLAAFGRTLLPAGELARALGTAAAAFVLGTGYVLGELPNSFLKRRLDVAPGQTRRGLAGAIFFVVDQADSVIAGVGLAALVLGLGWRLFLVGTAFLTLVHLFFNALLWAVKLRRNL